MSLDRLRSRLERIERAPGRASSGKVMRIITRSDEDATGQLASLQAEDRLGPDILVIDRRIVAAHPEGLRA